MYTYVYIHPCILTYTHVHPCTLLYTPMYTYMHSSTSIVHTSLYIHVNVHSQIDMCLCHTYWHCMYSYVYSWLPSYEMYTMHTSVYSTTNLELWSYIMPHMIQMLPYCITTQYPTRIHSLLTPVILITAYQQSFSKESLRNGIAYLLISLKLSLQNNSLMLPWL